MGEVINLDSYRNPVEADFFTILDEQGAFDSFFQASRHTRSEVGDIMQGNAKLGKNTFAYQQYISFIEKLFGECFSGKIEVDFCTINGIGVVLKHKNYRIEGLIGANCDINTLSSLIHDSLGRRSVFDIEIINFNHNMNSIEIVFRDDTQIKIPYTPCAEKNIFDTQIGF